MDLNIKPFFYRLRNLDGSNYDDSIATVVPQYWFSSSGAFNSFTLETENCTEGINFSQEVYKSMLKNVEISKFKCFKSNKYNLNLTYDPFDNKANYFNLYIIPCTNSTTNSNNCKSAEEISAAL
jgi:hypothetical protein